MKMEVDMAVIQTATEIRPFKVDIPEEELAEMRRRIAATRWPTKELVDDRSQGVQLATLQELARYWETDYDWRKAEARLNALPQFTTEIAQGGDVGAGVTDAMARQAPEGLTGIHTNLLVPALSGAVPSDTDAERAAAAQIATFQQSGNGYFVEMATRPQTIGYALLDSPIALAAWLVEHDTDAYYQIARAFVDGRPSGNLTRDHILDNITLYWLSGTGASAARSYWEAYRPDAPAAGDQPPQSAAIPFGFTTFPGEIWRTPRSWVEASYPNVIYFNEVDKGGHFAAWEEPEVFSEEVRAAFRSLR